MKRLAVGAGIAPALVGHRRGVAGGGWVARPRAGVSDSCPGSFPRDRVRLRHVRVYRGDAEVLARRGRRLVALLLYGGPVVLLGGLSADRRGHSVSALLVTGLVALRSAAPCPTWSNRCDARTDGCSTPSTPRSALVRADPETSIRDALAALQTFTGLTSQSPSSGRSPRRVS